MKILLNCHLPFLLAHGGMQIQIEQTKAAIESAGVEVEFLRWWDGAQKGDVLHHFGRIPTHLLRMAHDKGMKVVFTDLLTGHGSRSPGRLRLQRVVSRIVERTFPSSMTGHYNWESYREADALIANTELEKRLMTYLFGAPPERVHVVPNGVEEVFLNSPAMERGKWLVCTATITERKRVLELAEAAVRAQTPLWVVGRAYAEGDAYAERFFQLAKKEPGILRYEGTINGRAELAKAYRQARGFVLLSTMETRSLSAEEAAACQCPLLLSDLPWAREVFGEQASYCPITPDVAQTAGVLRKFYDAAPNSKPPARPMTWPDVGRMMRDIYAGLLKTSR